MNTLQYYDYDMEGVGFSPAMAASILGCELIDVHEPNSEAELQRGVGWATFRMKEPSGFIIFTEGDPHYSRMRQSVEKLRGIGMDRLQVVLGYHYRDQCNLDFDEVQIRALAEIGGTLLISCYDVSDGTENRD
jgi:hypothetical protein